MMTKHRLELGGRSRSRGSALGHAADEWANGRAASKRSGPMEVAHPGPTGVLSAILDAGSTTSPPPRSSLPSPGTTATGPSNRLSHARLLTEIGVLTPLQLDSDAVVYHRTDHHHGHLVCTECGTIVEMPPAALAQISRTLQQHPRFIIDTERFALSGTCQRCATPTV
jgi:Fur family ferric uptake transcriptional regulator